MARPKPDGYVPKVGAVLTFPNGVTRDQVLEALSNLGVEIETSNVQVYDGQYGDGPVFYIP